MPTEMASAQGASTLPTRGVSTSRGSWSERLPAIAAVWVPDRSATTPVGLVCAGRTGRLNSPFGPSLPRARACSPDQRRRSQRSWLATTTVPGVLQGLLELVGQGQRDVVRGLVEQQQVGLAGDQDRQPEPALLAGAEHPDRTGELPRVQQTELVRAGTGEPVAASYASAGAALGAREHHVLRQVPDQPGGDRRPRRRSARARPATTLSSVDFPDPFAPVTSSRPPAGTSTRGHVEPAGHPQVADPRRPCRSSDARREHAVEAERCRRRGDRVALEHVDAPLGVA